MMNGPEKSDFAIVAMKPANKAGQPAAEWVEPRAGTKGNTGQPHTRRTQSRGSVSQGLDRVRHVSPSNTQGRSRMLELGAFCRICPLLVIFPANRTSPVPVPWLVIVVAVMAAVLEKVMPPEPLALSVTEPPFVLVPESVMLPVPLPAFDVIWSMPAMPLNAFSIGMRTDVTTSSGLASST